MENFWFVILYIGVAMLVTFLLFVYIALKVDLDKMALKRLHNSGVDTNKTLNLEFLLEFSDEETARLVADALGKDDYTTRVEPAEDSKGFRCVAARSLVPELKRLKRIRERMYNTARPKGGIYEGWRAPEAETSATT